jgi:hypothetical protein
MENNTMNKMNKLGQLKIQQMAFMLIAVVLFFVVAGLFILSIYTSGIASSATSIEAEGAKLLVSKLANTPEFSCGDAFSIGGSGKTSCVDADKVMILKDNPDYLNFWGVASIEIVKVYPTENRGIECDPGTYPRCGFVKVFDRSDASTRGLPPASNFVSLCRKAELDGEPYDKCEIAKLLVSSVNLEVDDDTG